MSKNRTSKRRSTAGTKLVRGEFGLRPELLSEDPLEIMGEIRARRQHYVGEWTDAGAEDRSSTDAGGALIELFGEQMSTVRRRLNRLPDKTLIEFFRLAGILSSPPMPAEALIQFTVTGAPRSTHVPRGFQIGANPAAAPPAQSDAEPSEENGDDDNGIVVFETQQGLFVTAAEIGEIFVVEDGIARDVTAENGGARPIPLFGADPIVGNFFQIGIGDAQTPPPGPAITLAMVAAPSTDAVPQPVSSGGVSPQPLKRGPIAQWEAFVDGQWSPMEVIGDDPRDFAQTRLIELRTPRSWQPAIVRESDESRFWIRLRYVFGDSDRVPSIHSVLLNVVRSRAVRTIQNEVLLQLESTEVDFLTAPRPGRQTRMQLRHRPVVPDSVVIEIDTAPLDDRDGNDRDGDTITWKRTSSLVHADPQDRVFTVDAVRGIVTFGDGVHGAAVPPGFRNVLARSYETGGGTVGNVDEGQITTLLNSAPFLTAATNPFPATGGTDPTSRAETVAFAAELIRSGERAVAVTDYALSARRLGGALVARSHAISGFHPSYRRQSLPGVVGVLIMPPDRGDGPPVPDEAELQVIGERIANDCPGGVEVVTGSPNYRLIRVQVRFEPADDAVPVNVVRDLIAELNRFLHPLTGGERGTGWPFGGTLRFHALMLRLLRLEGVKAIPLLRLTVDGVSQRSCHDVTLEPDELFWSDGHVAIPVEAR